MDYDSPFAVRDMFPEREKMIRQWELRCDFANTKHALMAKTLPHIPYVPVRSTTWTISSTPQADAGASVAAAQTPSGLHFIPVPLKRAHALNPRYTMAVYSKRYLNPAKLVPALARLTHCMDYKTVYVDVADMVSRKPPSHENVFAFNVIYLYKTRLPEHDMAPLSAEDEFSDEEARIFTLAAFLELADAHIPINGTEIIVQCGVLSYAHSIYAVSKEPDSP